MTDQAAMLGMMRLNFLSAAAAAGRKKKGQDACPVLRGKRRFWLRLRLSGAASSPSRPALSPAGRWCPVRAQG